MGLTYCPTGDGGHLSSDTGRCIRCLNTPAKARTPSSPRVSEVKKVEGKKANPPCAEEDSFQVQEDRELEE